MLLFDRILLADFHKRESVLSHKSAENRFISQKYLRPGTLSVKIIYSKGNYR